MFKLKNWAQKTTGMIMKRFFRDTCDVQIIEVLIQFAPGNFSDPFGSYKTKSNVCDKILNSKAYKAFSKIDIG